MGRGTAYVKAKVGDKEATCKVTVNVPLTGINLKSETELLKGQTETLKVEYLPTDTTDDKTVTWISKNAEVAEVNVDGVVTAKKEGTAEIVAQVGSFEKTCTVTVKEIKMDSIEINVPDFELGLGRSQILDVLFNPENTTDDRTITWYSSNSDIVSVDAEGKVTAKGYGTATITAQVGDKMATVDVTVVEIPVENITIHVENSQVNIGDTIKLNIQVNPDDATNQANLKLTSSDNDIISIDEQGNIVAKSVGKAIITVEADNGIKNQIEIEVLEENIGESGEGVEEISDNAISETNTNKKNNQSNSPHTGDLPVEGLSILMLISMLGIIFIMKRRK